MPVVTSPFIEDSLVTSIPGSFRFEELSELVELLFTRCEHHDTRVEYVGPTNVGNSSKLMGKGEEVRHGPYGENIRVQED